MLLNARTNNGNGDWITVPHDGRPGANPRLIWFDGTFDGAGITLQHSFDGGITARLATGISFAAAGVKSIYLVPGQMLRAVVAGGAENTQSLSGDII